MLLDEYHSFEYIGKSSTLFTWSSLLHILKYQLFNFNNVIPTVPDELYETKMKKYLLLSYWHFSFALVNSKAQEENTYGP